eukprot:jgi/Mesen1/9498/ME000063S08941
MDDDWGGECYERPRLYAASGPAPVEEEEVGPSKLFIAICSGIGVAFIAAGVCTGGILQVATIWLALACLLGPHAPSSFTGGNCRVGVGGPLLEPEQDEEPSLERQKQSRQRGKSGRRLASDSEPELANLAHPDGTNTKPPGVAAGGSAAGSDERAASGAAAAGAVGNPAEWSVDEIHALKKAIAKHPKGTPARWEAIASLLGGQRSADEIVKMAKVLGQQKPGAGDAYSAFLAQRKASASKPIDSPLSQRWEGADGGAGAGAVNGSGVEGSGGGSGDWSDAEDKELVRALKEFPKDTARRWDRVASALPGKSKQQCFKRFGELKDSFKLMKAGADSEDGLEGGSVADA